MVTDAERVLLNQAAQGMIHLDDVSTWFRSRRVVEQRAILRELVYLASQAGAVPSDAAAVRNWATVPATSTAIRLLREDGVRALDKVAAAHADELGTSFRVVLGALAIADHRRRTTKCAGGCTHAWHRNLPAWRPGGWPAPSASLDHDYGADGLDIQSAMLRHARAQPDRERRSRFLRWNGQVVWTAFEIVVPRRGRFQLELLDGAADATQGVDVKVVPGTIQLPGGERVPHLRTWRDARFEDTLEYPYRSRAGILWVWNVYKWSWPGGLVTDEKWTGNAGFLAEHEGDGRWLFRCSDGPSAPPDFGRLVFRISVRGPE